MLEEGDCLFPSLDRDSCLASFHGNQRGSVGSMWYFFLGTLQTFFPLQRWTIEEEGAQREFQVLFNHGTFLWLTFWTLTHVSCVDLHIACIPVDEN